MSDVASPPIVPEGFDTDVYVVLEDFGQIGRAYRETDEERADRETLIRDLIAGQYDHPVRIVAFNTAQGWSRDVSAEIAREISNRASAKGEDLTGPVQAFVEYEWSGRGGTLVGHRHAHRSNVSACVLGCSGADEARRHDCPPAFILTLLGQVTTRIRSSW